MNGDSYCYLVGSDDVKRAADQMQDAAHDMNRAAETMDLALRRHQQAMADWLTRLEEILNRSSAK